MVAHAGQGYIVIYYCRGVDNFFEVGGLGGFPSIIFYRTQEPFEI